MSYVGCTSRRLVQSAPAAFWRVAKRFTHHAPDFFWMQKGVKNPEHCLIAPRLMSQYLQAASACRQKGKYSFVHARSALFRFPRVFFEEFHGKKTGFFRYLRYPAAQFAVEASTVKRKVDDYVHKHGAEGWTHGAWGLCHSRPDQDPALRSHLVSMSYAMVQPGVLESAGHFLFTNSSITSTKEIENLVETSIVRTLKFRGKEAKANHVIKAFRRMQSDYLSLKWGTAYLIGVPQSILNEVVYDSKSFGIPTGLPIEQIVRRSQESPRAFSCEEGGAQARLVICKTTMNPLSGIDVVDVTDAAEVESYCHGHMIVPSQEVLAYRSLFDKRREQEENMEIAKRKRLDEAVKDLARFALA